MESTVSGAKKGDSNTKKQQHGVHFLSENENSADEAHGREASVLAAFPKVLAVAQRSSRFRASPRSSVRFRAFSPAVKRAQILVRDERLGKAKSNESVAGAPAFWSEKGTYRRAFLADGCDAHEIGTLFERQPVGHGVNAAQRAYLLHADVRRQPDPVRGTLVPENRRQSAYVHDGLVPRPGACQSDFELGLAAVFVEGGSCFKERGHQYAEFAQSLLRLRGSVSATLCHPVEPAQWHFRICNPERAFLNERVVFGTTQLGVYGEVPLALCNEHLLKIPARRLTREESSYLLLGNALECFFEAFQVLRVVHAEKTRPGSVHRGVHRGAELLPPVELF